MRYVVSGDAPADFGSRGSRLALVTIALAAALVATAWGAGVAAAATMTGPPSMPNGYTLRTTIPLPGPAGHGDWVAFDPGTGDIYLSHHGQNFVVVDPRTNKVIANIDSPYLADANVMAFDPKYVYVTAGKSNQLVVISKASWKIVGTVQTESSPDGIWVDSARDRLYLISDDANRVEVYDMGNQPHLLAKYPLEPAKPVAGPDVGTLVPSKGTLYEPDDNLVLAMNINNGRIAKRLNTDLKIGKTGATKGIVYDPKTDRLWVGTTDKQVWIVNPDTLARITSVPATEADDQLVIDPSMRRVYAFGGHGFDVYNADNMQHLAYVDTGSAITHTGTVDLANHEVYVYEGKANVLGVYAKQS
jgi:hypothetical protein